MAHWANDAIFYHIYPLGLCGAPARNDFASPPTPRLEQLHGWLPHIAGLGANALYLGPVFESTAHGYDTADYLQVDRRLGTNETLARLADDARQHGLRLILDGVFNHVGRDFWAFRDVRERGAESAYGDWFANLHFGGRSPYGDPFTYEGWSGCYDLVKLNLRNPDVRAHLLQAVERWVHDYGIAGLRLDAADCVDLGFLEDLAGHCRRLQPDFWLLGEVVSGDYRRWAHPGPLDAVTNYEAYKALYSSHVDRNLFELAHNLEREFGPHGLYRGLPLYAFADNHDVHRVASLLTKPAHLYTLYALLFTMPGVPSLYYGSEFGLKARRTRSDDRPLRPRLDLADLQRTSPEPDLPKAIARFAAVRRRSAALRHGDYLPLAAGAEQMAFARRVGDESVVVAVSAADEPVALEVSVPIPGARRLVDLLNEGDAFPVQGGKARLEPMWPCWARVLAVE